MRFLRLLAVLLGAAVFAACGSGAAPSAGVGAKATNDGGRTSRASGTRGPSTTAVERVVDGDTIIVTGRVRVRLIGMDTPEVVDPREPVQCFGEAASRRTKALLPEGTAVRLLYDAEHYDRYGRTLAYVYRVSDGLFVNAELVREGYARVLTIPPNVAHVSEFVALAADARRAGRGLWSAC
jgi:micrococcal nuclease